MKDWSAAMEKLYEEVESGETTLEKAETLANVCGKALKYEALKFAREMFADKQEHGMPRLENRQNGAEVVATQ